MNTMDVKKEKEYLKKKHGISTFQELREATAPEHRRVCRTDSGGEAS